MDESCGERVDEGTNLSGMGMYGLEWHGVNIRGGTVEGGKGGRGSEESSARHSLMWQSHSSRFTE